ncbi:hypothetical protein BDN71DRAFT_1501333 [Pleurotus eryngii]|uniref:Protein-S-isoprenylcysteine O-methyltransferase n=1 Tax=Pleurotus eryngii TaxID=5323 RepID=A0A9P6AAV1_PLEER|nr:hypothetical protein BDN71DRAFT_1501333 [Pleurotus eryngii]
MVVIAYIVDLPYWAISAGLRADCSYQYNILLCALSFLHIAASASAPLHTNGGGRTTTYNGTLALSTLISLLSTSLRLWCFAALGRFFDFQATLKKDHRLVTRGPYAYVRHPSYAGLAGSYVRTLLMLVAAGRSWVGEYTLMGWVSWVGWAVWCAESAVIFAGVPRRVKMEDAALRERFGRKWEEYARRVPYKVVPRIYVVLKW